LRALLLRAPSCRKRNGDIDNAIKTVSNESESNAANYRGQMIRMDRPYFVGERISLEQRKAMLPPELDKLVTFRSVGVQSLSDIVESISQSTRVPMYLGVVSTGAQGGTQTGAGMPGAAGGLPGLPLPPVPGGVNPSPPLEFHIISAGNCPACSTISLCAQTCRGATTKKLKRVEVL